MQKQPQQPFFSGSIVELCISENFTGIINGMKILSFFRPITASIEWLLASHINSKGILQSSAITTGAVIRAFFNSTKAFKQSSSKLKGLSCSRNMHNGLANFEKSLMNLL